MMRAVVDTAEVEDVHALIHPHFILEPARLRIRHTQRVSLMVTLVALVGLCRRYA